MEEGSSPLARGLPWLGQGRESWTRIIPARAGFTQAEAWESISRRDHPRSRGVYCGKEFVTRGNGGSSPLARGLPRQAPISAPPSRIIPARAGFTRAPRCPCGPRKDHPRSRGVYSWSVRLMRVLVSDHPRSRGVYNNPGTDWSRGYGSSPLARGLRPRRRQNYPTASDHPRSRGVYWGEISGDVSASGSSPLARGLPAGHTQDDAAAGIIPARAGFTSGFSLRR